MAKTAVNTTGKLANKLLGIMLGGEKTKKFQTPSLGLEIAKTDTSNLPDSYSVNGGDVAVPAVMKSLIANITKVSVGCKRRKWGKARWTEVRKEGERERGRDRGSAGERQIGSEWVRGNGWMERSRVGEREEGRTLR